MTTIPTMEMFLKRKWKPMDMEELKNCYACSICDFYDQTEDEWLAHMTEQFCQTRCRIPYEEDFGYWLDIRTVIHNAGYSFGDTMPKYVNLMFGLDADIPYIIFSGENKALLTAFAVYPGNYQGKDALCYNWDDWYEYIGTYFQDDNETNKDDEKSRANVCCCVLNQNLIDSRPENYFVGNDADDTAGGNLQKKAWKDYKEKSFAECLRKKLNEQNMTDPECYRKAQLSAQVFHSIISGQVRPHRMTAFAICLAVELTYGETKELLSHAGYTFDYSDPAECVIGHAIAAGNYNLDQINRELYDNDLRTLGTRCYRD